MLGGRNPGLGLAILRVVIGLIFVMHGWPKLAGGIEGTAAFLGSLGVPLSGVVAWGSRWPRPWAAPAWSRACS